MSRFNSFGTFVSGNGGQISYDGILAGGNIGERAQWLTDNLIIASVQFPDGKWRVGSFDVWNPTAGWTELYHTGANGLEAGGGRWAGFTPADGVFGHITNRVAGLSLQGTDGRGAGAPDGTLATVANYQIGTGLQLNGVEIAPHQVCRQVQILSPTTAVWDGGGNVPVGTTLPFQRMRFVGDWRVYYTEGWGIVAHPADRPQEGRVLTQVGFHHDAVMVGDRLLVGWSRGQAELPTEWRVVNALDYPITDLTDGVSTGLPVSAVVAINRNHALGFFCGSPDDPVDSWKTTIDPKSLPGNMYMLRKDATLYNKQDIAFARYVQGGTVEEIEAQASASDLPAVCYWDARTWPRWPTLPANAYLCVQAYWHVGESIETFENEIRNIVGDASNRGYNVCLVPQVYTSNSGNQSDLGSVCVVTSRIARDYPRVAITLGFSGTGRQTGLWQHPEATPYWQRYAAGITGMPDFGQGDQVSAPNEFAVVQQAAAEFPHLLQTNTIVSCTEFTQRVLERLNSEWGCVGKTAGEGQGKPEGFEPRSVRGVDGNMYLITGISYDVLFHAPSYRQVDILGNATANEPGPWPKGPANPVWNEIPPEHYRANNPWIEKVPLAGEQPPPTNELPTIGIFSFPTTYRRGEAGGLIVSYSTGRPLDGAFVDVIEVWLNDGGPKMAFQLLPPGGTWNPGEKDAPYFPTVGFKADRNGTYNLFMRCRTVDGRWSQEVQGDHTVTITE